MNQTKYILLFIFIACNHTSPKDISISSDQRISKNTNPNQKSEWPVFYAQKDSNFPGYCAELFLEKDSSFKFEDRRDESCWLWSTTSGKWLQKNDTLILSPGQEVNLVIKLQDRRFIMRDDSLFFINSKEKNPDINWGDFGVHRGLHPKQPK